MQQLHIISFDNPHPPSYGGVIDVYFKIRALHGLGWKIHLHCFTDEQNVPAALNAITEKVHFYRTSKSPLLLFSRWPFSVVSRRHGDLLKNLREVDAPILFEGLKTTWLVSADGLPGIRKVLRLHNIEQDYFAGIAGSEQSWWRRITYGMEAKKYARYDAVLAKFDHVACLSKSEHQQVAARFGNSVYVPVFHGNTSVRQMDGFGKNVLYHGDLGTSDNVRSALFLIDCFREMPEIELVIASGTRNAEVDRRIASASNISFVRFNEFSELETLFGQAHINISWSFQRSGTKLKVINSLYCGRHCVINQNITDDENLVSLCSIALDKTELQLQIRHLMGQRYADSGRRGEVLEKYLDDFGNAAILAKLLS